MPFFALPKFIAIKTLYPHNKCNNQPQVLYKVDYRLKGHLFNVKGDAIIASLRTANVEQRRHREIFWWKEENCEGKGR